MDKEVATILIVRTSAIGDVIQSLHALQYLRNRFPKAQIDWVVEKTVAPLLMQIDSHPIDRVLTIDTGHWKRALFSLQTWKDIRHFFQTLRKNRYDIVFDLQGNTKSGVITALVRAQEKVGFGWKSVREKTNLLATSTHIDFPASLNIREKYLGLVRTYYKDKEAVKTGVTFRLSTEERGRLQEWQKIPPIRLMIAVGSKWKNKQLSMETLIGFLKRVSRWIDPTFLFIFSGAQEKGIADTLVEQFPGRSLAIGGLSLPLWQALMQETQAVVAVDSAALHLVGTTQTPSFSIFGPTAAAIFKPVGELHGTLQGPCPYHKTFSKQCPQLRTCKTGGCIRGLKEEEVFEAFQAWFVQAVNPT